MMVVCKEHASFTVAGHAASGLGVLCLCRTAALLRQVHATPNLVSGQFSVTSEKGRKPNVRVNNILIWKHSGRECTHVGELL